MVSISVKLTLGQNITAL